MTGTTTQRADVDRRWFKRFGRTGPAETRLFCFHYAGGNASVFRGWPQDLPWYIEPVAVQLPGRADRFTETPYERMTPLIDDLVGAMEPLLDRPFALYGVSMGARVSWALTHALRERGLPGPRALFVAASVAPACDDGQWEWDGREDGLEGYVRDMGGTPVEVLEQPELLAGLLPTLRADLTVLSTHDFHPETPLDIPIHAFAGTEDPEAHPARMEDWSRETRDRFSLTPVPGGHFFDDEGRHQVVREIVDRLE
ncbi:MULTISPECIES: thioesterase II family protein [unclassified Streptomyces]|uniref:thioesterase II family protein n=1 Tax=unclassified Streptomyces TaxID=2593676 RepID=UPI001F03F3B4|nr:MULTISPECIES: thioesterase domain-containing protein [unclassified Streptomyces]MCH0563640.1 thioesterase [Streptomyces sp. MUM 2J]MCH0570774.1 thioesterase [Streptomyces sp. MUM 136J]